jgi:hypothetical protein
VLEVAVVVETEVLTAVLTVVATAVVVATEVARDVVSAVVVWTCVETWVTVLVEPFDPKATYPTTPMMIIRTMITAAMTVEIATRLLSIRIRFRFVRLKNDVFKNI